MASKKNGSFSLTDPLGTDMRASGKAGGAANSVRVILLDGSAQSVSLVDKKMLGQVAFDQVVRKLDLLERDYFGLLYEDDHKTMQWLDLLKPIRKQLKKQPFTMFFRVKFYAVEPLALHRNSKEQFYLQLKDDINAGRLPFPSDSAHSILSYVLQADVGDYSNSHDDLQYLEGKGLLTLGKDRTAESSIIKLHKLLQGKGADVAVEKFLRKTRELDSYGAKFYIVQYEGIPYRMGMSPSGITLYQDTRRTAHFKWRKVSQVSYKQKRFTLVMKSKTSETGEKTIVYEIDSAKLCKEMWEVCVERVSFYNDHQPRHKEETTDPKSRSPSPPITREYATINDATPQLEAARQQDLQSSPIQHNSQSQSQCSQPQGGEEQVDREEEGMVERRGRSEKRGRRKHRSKKEEHSHRNGKTRGVSGDGVGMEKSEHTSTEQQEHSEQPQSNFVIREHSQDREEVGGNDDDDTLTRKPRVHTSNVHSLPRRLPTGDPMLHHMMQFQNLERRSSGGTLLSDSDNSAAGTTSPIVSTCDEVSECPELPQRARHRMASRDPHDDVFLGGHIRSYSLPQPQTEQWDHQTPQRVVRNDDSRHSKRQVELHDGGQDHSVSEDRETTTGECSMHDSLEELADLLGEEEEISMRQMDEDKHTRSLVQDNLTDDKDIERVELPFIPDTVQEQQQPALCKEPANDESSPELAREERQRRRRQKQLQKQILLQRQQMKEQKLHEYLKKQKQKEHKQEQSLVTTTSALHTDKEKRHSPHKEPMTTHQNESSHASRAHGGDIRTRERGQYSLKSHSEQSHKGPNHSPNRHHSDAAALRDKRKEERDMVRSWAKAQRKAQKESHLQSTATSTSSAHANPHGAPKPSYNPSTEPIYNTLAPLQPKGDDQDTAMEMNGRSMENLPSSPPPPPYKSPSPSHQAAMGLVQIPSYKVEDSTQHQKPSGHERQSPAHQHSSNSHTTATPPTPPRSGDRVVGSTLTNSPHSLDSSVNRSPRYTQSFSGGSPMNSNAGSAAGSPRAPIRAHSLKSDQYSPLKQQSPSFTPKKRHEHERNVGNALSDFINPGELEQVQSSDGAFEAAPINIDPSALQKEDLTIAPHNFLNMSSSPPYDKLGEDEGKKDVSVPPTSKRPPASGTQYKLETALQEVMTSENLPPPPTHLLEISGQLEDIDYQDLGTRGSPAVSITSPQQQWEMQKQQQKREVNPEMIAKSLSAARKSPNPTSYPPHIAKFMSRVRNTSTDADDPIGGLLNDNTNSDSTRPPTASVGTSLNDDVFTKCETTNQQQSTSGSRHTFDEHNGFTKTPLGSLENANKQSGHSHSVSSTGARPWSNSAYPGGSKVTGTSYSLPRGHYTATTMQHISTQSRSRETTPSSALTPSDLSTGGVEITNRENQLQSLTKGVQQSSTINPQNGSTPRGQSRPPPIPIRSNRATAGGDSIPSSPTYFTNNHPHKDEPIPSPKSQFINQSFKEHLTSLQPSKRTRSTNITTWMQQSSNYWNSNKSGPFKGPRGVATTSSPANQFPHLFEQSNKAHQTLPNYPIPIQAPGMPPTQGQPHSLQQQPLMHPRNQLNPSPSPALVHPGTVGSGEPNLLTSSVSNTSLHSYRNRSAALRASQPLPNYPRPHSARTATMGDNYYVLDV